MRMLVALLAALLLLAAPARAFDFEGIWYEDNVYTGFSGTGNGTSSGPILWQSCNLVHYQAIMVEFDTGTSGTSTQMQTRSADSTGNNPAPGPGTGPYPDGWMPDGVGQGYGVAPSTVPQDATGTTSKLVIVWKKFLPCMRLRIIGGSGSVSGRVRLGALVPNDWNTGWDNQNPVDSSRYADTNPLFPGDNLVLPGTSGVRQYLDIELVKTRTDKTAHELWVNYGAPAAVGIGEKITDADPRLHFSLQMMGGQHKGFVPRGEIHIFWDSTNFPVTPSVRIKSR